MRAAYVASVARTQRVTRDVILTVAETVRAGDTERAVCARMEREFEKAHVEHWLHTPYAWWGERTRFDWRGTWETNALPSERVLQVGEPFILDAAPLVDGYPADFAYSGFAPADPAGESESAHRALLVELTRLKTELLAWATPDVSSAELCERVEHGMTDARFDVIHTRYPANVLGHSLDGFPNWCSSAPRIGTGFQLPLVLSAATRIVLHHLTGAAYPFLRARAPGRPRGLYAVEPHLGRGALGAKFESVLLVDGDETRWLDPGLFGEVVG